MARTAGNDPVEKFRFLVSIFEPSKALIAVNASTSLVNNGANIARIGFQFVTAPEARVVTMHYRENIDGLAPRKIAGLAEYLPITMRRGVLADTSLFNFFTAVNNEASTLNTFNTALASSFGVASIQKARYRQDMLISSVDRAGNFVKHWYISNAYVVGYKGGNDFDASTDEKLIEEVIFDYESFIEVLGATVTEALNNVSQLAALAEEQAAAAKALSVGVGFGASFL